MESLEVNQMWVEFFENHLRLIKNFSVKLLIDKLNNFNNLIILSK